MSTLKFRQFAKPLAENVRVGGKYHVEVERIINSLTVAEAMQIARRNVRGTALGKMALLTDLTGLSGDKLYDYVYHVVTDGLNSKLKENEEYEKNKKANVERHLKNHDEYSNSLKKYGTIEVGPPFVTKQKCVMGELTKLGRNRYAIDFVTVDQVKDKSYSGTSSVGVLVTLDAEGKIAKTDIEISDRDKEKLLKFISDKK